MQPVLPSRWRYSQQGRAAVGSRRCPPEMQSWENTVLSELNDFFFFFHSKFAFSDFGFFLRSLPDPVNQVGLGLVTS